MSLSSFAFFDNGSIGARSSAMAKSSICLIDVLSARNNQAGLGFCSSTEVAAFYENRFLIKELSQSGFVATLPIKNGTFGLNYSAFGYKLYKESHVALAYGLKLSETVSAGASLDYLNTRIADIYGTSSAVTGSFGFIVKLQPQFVIATHIYNPVRSQMINYSYEKIPTVFRIGLQYVFSDKVFLMSEAEKVSDKKMNLKTAIEYNPVQPLFIRIGAGSFPTQMTFGVGFIYNGLKIDVSSGYQNLLGFSNQIGLSYCLVKSYQKSNKSTKTLSSY